MAQSEQEEFLKDLGVENKDVLEQPLVAEPEKVEEAEDSDEVKKNRAFRRMEAKYQKEREMGIALNARLQALSETQKFRQEVGEDDPLKPVEAIFGTDTPEKKQATDILKKALEGMSERSIQKALEKVEEREGNETAAVREEEENLDTMAERWEDEHDIDMSDDATRKRIYTLLEKLSPKDDDGNIKEYADPDAVAEVFKSTVERPSRAKELASRSMTRSGASQPSKIEEDSVWKALKEAGIF